MSKEFKEAETCETPGQCKLLGNCFRAHVIKTELKNIDRDKEDSALESTVNLAKCKHSQVIKITKKAHKVLDARKS